MKTAVELLEHAQKEIRKERIRSEWSALYPYMVMEQITYKSFEEYYDLRTGAGIDMRPEEEILAEVREIRKKLEEG